MKSIVKSTKVTATKLCVLHLLDGKFILKAFSVFKALFKENMSKDAFLIVSKANKTQVVVVKVETEATK